MTDATAEDTVVRPGQATTLSMVQNRRSPCATVDPQRLAVSVPAGSTATTAMTLTNTGISDYHATLATSPETLKARGGRPGDVLAASPTTSDKHANASYRATNLLPSWYRASDYPGGQAVACDVSELHQFGGYSSGADFVHKICDTVTDTWRYGPSLPVRVGGAAAAAAAWNGRLYLVGGLGDTARHTTGYRSTTLPPTHFWIRCQTRCRFRCSGRHTSRPDGTSTW